MRTAFHFLLLLSLGASCVHAPPVANRVSEFKDAERQRYVAHRTTAEITIDGKLSEAAWSAALPTEAFVDIRGGAHPAPRHRTIAKMLWNDEYFFVAAELVELHLWGTLTERDSVIYHDNDFEVFIDPDGDTHDYYELEINALGTEWDLLLEKPYRDGGPPLHEFDTPGLQSAVSLDGTLNDATDEDEGWSVEIAIPWNALKAIAGRPVPPTDGDVWWVNFSRVQWRLDQTADARYTKRTDANGKALPEDNWVWSPQGVIAMHEPESWGLVMFAEDEVGGAARAFVDPFDFEERSLLRQVYRAQRTFGKRHGEFTNVVAELTLADFELAGRTLELFTTPSGFEAVLTWRAAGASHTLRIDEQGHLW